MRAAAIRHARRDNRASKPPGSGSVPIAAGRTSVLNIKVRHALKLVEPRLDLGGSQPQQTREPELFDREARHHGTVDEGASQVRKTGVAGTAQVAHEATCKGIAGAGWIADLFERVAGREEDAVILKKAG